MDLQENVMNEVEFEIEYMKRLFQMVSLAAWSNEDKMYSPVWGRDGYVVAYAPINEATELFNLWVEEYIGYESALIIKR